MANRSKQVQENVAGDFFVDVTCIDCDTCRQIAPTVFGEGPNHAYVHHQPMTAVERRQALRALVCCPTGSIGTDGEERPVEVMGDFPLPIELPVYYCGFNSPRSYGGNSYFVQHPAGNWLIDSPKFLPRLVARLSELGGVDHIFLTHQDDVADASRYAERFGSTRYIHRAELSAQPEAEVVLEGDEPVPLGTDFLAIPTPGHTRGHCVLLVRNRFLFTGDHLAWDRHGNQLEAFHDYCWYSWEKQIESMQRLLAWTFEWILPGHGERVHLAATEMRHHLEKLVGRMSSLER